MGRTGTTSMQKALEILGLGPCYHMNQVLPEPGCKERMEGWADAMETEDGTKAMKLMEGLIIIINPNDYYILRISFMCRSTICLNLR